MRLWQMLNVMYFSCWWSRHNINKHVIHLLTNYVLQKPFIGAALHVLTDQCIDCCQHSLGFPHSIHARAWVHDDAKSLIQLNVSSIRNQQPFEINEPRHDYDCSCDASQQPSTTRTRKTQCILWKCELYSASERAESVSHYRAVRCHHMLAHSNSKQTMRNMLALPYHLK